MEVKTVAEINQYTGSSVNPLEYPEQIFELYSVPSFETGYPEIIKGKEIGSTKITVKEGDVLVCKINPRINRVWVVRHNTEHPLLASSEWIVVRNSELDSNYLKWYFTSPTFRALLNSQVAGIGGSLTRAQPKQVAKYPIPIPSVAEQENISKILDKVDKLMSLRREQLAKLDQLVKARFVEMFGDLKSNSKNWMIVNFKECATIDTYMIHDFTGYGEYPHIGIDSIEKETGRLSGYRTIAEDAVISGKYLFSPEHIIYSKIRPNLNKVATPNFDGLCSADAYPILVKKDVCSRMYLAFTMRSSYFLDYILTFSNRTNLPKVNKSQVEGFALPLPPIELQKQFAAFIEQTDKSQLTIQQSLDKLELLKKSLMQEYFG